MTTYETEPINQRETAVIAGLHLPQISEHEFASSLTELVNLADTAGADVVAEVTQKRERPDPAYYIGAGKVQEIQGLVEHFEADLVIFDQELTPVQIRNLEKKLDVKIVDRTRLILDIFARHARSKEGMIQVELAQLQYTLPRLTGKGVELSRQGGGIGTRGAGEKKLELDRRRIRDKMADLQRQLKTVQKQRNVRRERRQRSGIPVVSVVGYTNAGKSSLFNAMYRYQSSQPDDAVQAENKLFATLTTTVRQIEYRPHRAFLLSDTVGFIQNLPHHLVAAFRSTLEEALEADLLLHVVDASNPAHPYQMETVDRVLSDLGADEIPCITVFNKIDCLTDEEKQSLIPPVAGACVLVSARTGEGLEPLFATIDRMLQEQTSTYTFFIPYESPQWLARLYQHGEVVERREEECGWKIKIRMAPHEYGRIKPQLEEDAIDIIIQS